MNRSQETLKLASAGRTQQALKAGPHGSEEMVNRYTHLRPDFMQSELEKVPDYAPRLSTKIAEFDPIDPQAVVAASCKNSVCNTSGIV